MISTSQSFFQLIVVLVCFVVVIVLAYYTTRWMANYQKGRSFNKNLKIIETLKLSPDKYVQIIACGKNKYLIVGLSKNEVTLLGELNEDELIDLDSIVSENNNNNNNASTGFSQIIEKMKSKK
ncbi:MAG: flagellar biosynthetic protein FliO [Lachnospiraceae bacterium]|nr:flagellar biosynthetic protein FliO [Lachnospiraceae bacterium]